MKKSQKTLEREALTKSLDERYAEATKGEKIGYWIFTGIGIALVAILLWQ